MTTKKPTKIATHVTAWPSIEGLSEEYALDMDTLVNAIEEKKIKTRGKIYDDYEGYSDSPSDRGDGYTEIPEEKWSEYLFDHEICELKDGQKHSQTLLYCFQYLPFMGVAKAQEIRSGYANIQVSRSDFIDKVKTKNLPNGKRVHKQIKYIREIYDRLKQVKKENWLSPEEVLQFAIDNYSEDAGGTYNFEIDDAQEHPTNKRQSKILYVVENRDGTQEMTFGRFYNIIARFNKESAA